MKKIIFTAAIALSAVAGVAQAGVSNLDYLQAARCRGLAASEGLGKVDTAGIDAFLKQETAMRELPVRVSAGNRISSAQKEGDKAEGAKKDKLLAERSGVCSAYLGAGTGSAINTSN